MYSESKTTLDLRQKRDISQTIGTGFQYIRQHWRSLYGPVFLVCIPIYLVGALLLGQFFRTSITHSVVAVGDLTPMATVSMVAGYLLTSFAGLLLSTIVYEHMAHYLRHGGEAPRMSQLYPVVWHKWPSYLAIGILCALAIIFGVLLGFIGAVWLAVALSMAFPVRAFEGQGAVESIQLAFKLVWLRWWKTFGLLLLVVILVSMMVFIVYMPFAMLAEFGLLSGLITTDDALAGQGAMQGLISLATLLAGVGSLVLQPLVLVPLGVHALSLIEDKMGRGLLQRVERAELGNEL